MCAFAGAMVVKTSLFGTLSVKSNSGQSLLYSIDIDIQFSYSPADSTAGSRK
jgi:hypothetical protein